MVLQYLSGVGGGLRRTLSDTSPTVAFDPFKVSVGYHRLLRSFYENTMYEDVAMWQAYKARHRLPRGQRGIYNPTRRAVNFWPGRVYPGTWTEDGRPLPDGTPHCIPFPTDVIEESPELVTASLQSMAWGNWNAHRMVYVRECAILGTVFVEMVDDLERGKVYPEIVPLERVTDIRLDATGNVKAYQLEYAAFDHDTNVRYDYRKTVDQDEIVEYRNTTVVRRDENPYGFVPAVWVKFNTTGSVFGSPVIAGVIPKIDEINRLATYIHNYVGVVQRQPVVFWSKTPPAPLGAKPGETDSDTATLTAESIPWLHSTDPDGRVGNMMQPVPIDGAGDRVDKLMNEIEDDLPELTLDKELRAMSQVTGPGAAQMMGDVRGRHDEAQANFDAGTVKLLQMGTAIGGWRLDTGAWGGRGQLTRQQQKFDGFGLESYAAGDLDVTLLPRPLVPSTEMERMTALEMKKSVIGGSDDWARREIGMDEDEIAQMNTEVSAQSERLAVGSF
jgi:hypothetical protein